MSSDPIEVLRKLEAKLNRLEAKYREAIKGRDAADPLTNHRLGLSEGFGVAAMCVRDALASLSAPKRHKRPKGNTPIEELMAEYEADGCDHSNMVWVRAAAQRYVETMEDSQVRCLLHVLSAPKPPSMNDNAVAVNESAPVNDKPESAEAVLRAAAEYHYAQAANPTDQFGNTSNHRNPKLEAWHRQVADAITSITAPPRPEASAPVGVERKYPDDGNGDEDAYNLGWNECIDTIASVSYDGPYGVRAAWGRITAGNGFPCDYEVVGQALAKIALAQQPAAVDEAMVERAITAFFTHPGRGVNGTDDAMRAALTAALAGQQQGGTPE